MEKNTPTTITLLPLPIQYTRTHDVGFPHTFLLSYHDTCLLAVTSEVQMDRPPDNHHHHPCSSALSRRKAFPLP